MITYILHWQGFRESSYELVFSVFKDGELLIGNAYKHVGARELDKAGIDRAILEYVDEMMKPAPETEKDTYTKIEVETFLRDKGYLKQDESIGDLKSWQPLPV